MKVYKSILSQISLSDSSLICMWPSEAYSCELPLFWNWTSLSQLSSSASPLPQPVRFGTGYCLLLWTFLQLSCLRFEVILFLFAGFEIGFGKMCASSRSFFVWILAMIFSEQASGGLTCTFQIRGEPSSATRLWKPGWRRQIRHSGWDHHPCSFWSSFWFDFCSECLNWRLMLVNRSQCSWSFAHVDQVFV